MTRVLLILFFIFFLASCQAAPATVPATARAETAPPNETPLPPPAATLTPIPTINPTPAVSAAELIRRARPVCENSFTALVESGPLTPPFAVMKKTVYSDIPAWDLAHQLPHMSSLSAGEVQTLFCISETRAQTGTYTDGSPAYQLFWDIRVVSWPGGKVIGRSSFTGSPPKAQASASAAAEETYPYLEFAAWVFLKVPHPNFLHFNDAITTIAISPDQNIAAFGSAIANQIVDRDYQARVLLFRPSDMQIISAVEGHQGMITSLAFAPDGKILASGGFDRFVKFWDVATSRLLGQVNPVGTPNSLIFSPDGARLAVASNLQVDFIDMLSMRVERSLQETGGNDLAYSPDDRQVYVHSLGSIKVIDPGANRVMMTFPDRFALVPTLSVAADGSVTSVTYESPERVDGFSLSPDGAQIVTYTVERLLNNNPSAENVRLAIWDAKTGKYLSEVRFSGDSIISIRFSPGGNQLAVGHGDQVWIWDTTNWQVTEKLTGHVGDIVDLAFTPNGTQLLSAGSDGTIRVWPLEN